MTNKFKRQVSSQFIQDTIPQSKDAECARCQMLEVEIERKDKLMQGWDKTEAEIRVDAVNEFMRQVIRNEFYNEDVLINFYRNWVKGLEDEK
ncbi:hypothetical protein DES39_0509 [Orbus hercynius]|uniref:Uncharacterized protein n=1 Tax=Orbus hercynius TaxID=593135 RepID=A0A495RIV8_9GAMM|nr:hypothetical protein [Orbus hercynius]RKS87289.1 hypothetical protein DES39_0509 [Orbus hercynius]